MNEELLGELKKSGRRVSDACEDQQKNKARRVQNPEEPGNVENKGEDRRGQCVENAFRVGQGSQLGGVEAGFDARATKTSPMRRRRKKDERELTGQRQAQTKMRMYGQKPIQTFIFCVQHDPDASRTMEDPGGQI